MKRTVILLVFVLLYGLFLPNHAIADYTKDLDACNKILSKSSSPNTYCTLHIDVTSGNRVTGPMVTISNSYVYPESGIERATKFLEEEYKGKLNWMQNPSDQREGFAKYMKVIEEAGPDSMKFLIRQSADEGFYTIGPNTVYNYDSYLFMQQGSCVMVVAGAANIGYVKSQNNKIDDVSGDVESLKKESITYMNKVGNDLTKNCKKEIIKTETPAAPALIDKPPKQSDFRKVDRSDFKLVYPVGTNSAYLKTTTESAGMTSETSSFLGVVGDSGQALVKFPNGESVTLEDKQAIDIGIGDIWKRGAWVDYPPHKKRDRQLIIQDVDCHILLEQEKRDQEDLKRLGFIIKPMNFNFDNKFTFGLTEDCSYVNEGDPVRVLVEQWQVTFKTPGGATVSADNADFGIGYDAKSAISIAEVYNGSITVTNKTGNVKTISAVYGSEIKQIEVDKNGVMGEKIAIPQSQWEAFLASQQKKDEESNRNILLIIGTVAIFGAGGISLFLHRKGKLMPLYKTLGQKVSGVTKKINKTGKEIEKN